MCKGIIEMTRFWGWIRQNYIGIIQIMCHLFESCLLKKKILWRYMQIGFLKYSYDYRIKNVCWDGVSRDSQARINHNTVNCIIK